MHNTGDEVSVSNKEIFEAVLENNYSIVEMLEGFDFVRDCTPTHFTIGMRKLASTMLVAASAAENNELLDEEFALTLISYTAGAMEFFNLLIPIGIHLRKHDRHKVVPRKLRKLFLDNNFGPEVETKIAKLNKEQLTDLIVYLTSGFEVMQLHVLFTLPIVKAIYQQRLIPHSLLFAYMAAALQEPPEASMPDIGGLIGAMILGGGLF